MDDYVMCKRKLHRILITVVAMHSMQETGVGYTSLSAQDNSTVVSKRGNYKTKRHEMILYRIRN